MPCVAVMTSEAALYAMAVDFVLFVVLEAKCSVVCPMTVLTLVR